MTNIFKKMELKMVLLHRIIGHKCLGHNIENIVAYKNNT